MFVYPPDFARPRLPPLQKHCPRSSDAKGTFKGHVWVPDKCRLPSFNPMQALEALEGRRVVFAGDSIMVDYFLKTTEQPTLRVIFSSNKPVPCFAFLGLPCPPCPLPLKPLIWALSFKRQFFMRLVAHLRGFSVVAQAFIVHGEIHYTRNATHDFLCLDGESCVKTLREFQVCPVFIRFFSFNILYCFLLLCHLIVNQEESSVDLAC
jgi:hypothetical protein